MSMVLTKTEALEIINTMLDELGLPRCKEIVMGRQRYQYSSDEHNVYSTRLYAFKLFWWNISFRILNKEPWASGYTLEQLVKNAEHALAAKMPQVEEANQIRQRHATRLLDKEIRRK